MLVYIFILFIWKWKVNIIFRSNSGIAFKHTNISSGHQQRPDPTRSSPGPTSTRSSLSPHRSSPGVTRSNSSKVPTPASSGIGAGGVSKIGKVDRGAVSCTASVPVSCLKKQPPAPPLRTNSIPHPDCKSSKVRGLFLNQNNLAFSIKNIIASHVVLKITSKNFIVVCYVSYRKLPIPRGVTSLFFRGGSLKGRVKLTYLSVWEGGSCPTVFFFKRGINILAWNNREAVSKGGSWYPIFKADGAALVPSIKNLVTPLLIPCFLKIMNGFITLHYPVLNFPLIFHLQFFLFYPFISYLKIRIMNVIFSSIPIFSFVIQSQ